MRLSNDQISECLAPSTKYEEAAYKAVYDSVKLGKNQQVVGEGRLEAGFPGVKPQHVAYKLLQLKGDDECVTVVIHATHGVSMIRRATPLAKPEASKTEAKPKAKPAAKKAAGKPKASKPKTEQPAAAATAVVASDEPKVI